MFKVIFAVIVFGSAYAQANICQQWSAPMKAGRLDEAMLPEASGLAISRQFADRLYHINDSGDGPYFYTTSLTGAKTERIEIQDFKAKDVEDIAVGPCAAGTCVFVADIGDNAKKRSHVEVMVIPEVATFLSPVQAVEKLVLEFPDGPRDAESLAIDPVSGDLLILSKEYNGAGQVFPARLYRLPATEMKKKKNKVEPTLLTFVGEVDLPRINKSLSSFGQIATAMDISPDGQRLLVLTYENAIEISMAMLKTPIKSGAWVEGVDYGIAGGPRLTTQQEAISYAVDGKSFYFDSEFNPGSGGDTESVLYEVRCLR